MGDDNWAIFYTFSSEVSEKPGFRNNYFFSKYVVQLLRKVPVLFRASDTSTYAKKMVFSKTTKKPTPSESLLWKFCP